MEFLFLNESSDSIDSMKAFVESIGIEVADNRNKTLEEVMLECEEGIHEAEMKAMQEEFALYQESVLLEEEDASANKEKAWYAKAWDKIVEWWHKLVKFLADLWIKICHWADVAVNWIRKTIQAAIMKVTKRDKMYIPEDLKLNEVALNAVKDMYKHFKSLSTPEEVKNKAQINLNYYSNHNVAALSKKTKEISFEAWKSEIDAAVKKMDELRKQAQSAKAEAAANFKEIEAKIKAAKKDESKTDTERKEIVNEGNVIKEASKQSAKMFSKAISHVKWYASKLFSAGRSKQPK